MFGRVLNTTVIGQVDGGEGEREGGRKRERGRERGGVRGREKQIKSKQGVISLRSFNFNFINYNSYCNQNCDSCL